MLSLTFCYRTSMSKHDRDKWNQRYAEGRDHNSSAVVLLEDWLPRLPVGRALDVACGAGRNALLLAQAGYQVDAIDISDQGLSLAKVKAEQSGLHINWIEQDLDQPYRFDSNYDLIIVMWYVNLGLIGKLCDCLVPGGYLLSQQHLITDQAVIGPSNTNYRVAPGELHDVVSRVDVIHYDESIETNADGKSVAGAQLVVRKPAEECSLKD
jgi:SAM-dependent methyltransferase